MIPPCSQSLRSIAKEIARWLASAATLAILGVVLVDVVLRQLPMETLMPTHVGNSAEYRAILADIQTQPNCEICFVGDSRISEAISLPRLRREFQDSGYDVGKISNYGASLANMSMVGAIGNKVLQEGKPKVVVVGVTLEMFVAQPHPNLPYGLFLDRELLDELQKSALQFGAGRRSREEGTRLWNLEDTIASSNRESTWYDSPSIMSLAGQAFLGRFWWAFRFRDRPTQWLRDTWVQLQNTHRDRASSPLLGGEPRRQSQEPNRSLKTYPMDSKAIDEHLVDNIGDDLSRFRPENIHAMTLLIQSCRRRGILAILLEMPLPDVLLQRYPAVTHKKFVDLMWRFEKEFEAIFVEWNQNEEALDESDFLDFSHLNRHGSKKFSTVFARRLKELFRSESLSEQGR